MSKHTLGIYYFQNMVLPIPRCTVYQLLQEQGHLKNVPAIKLKRTSSKFPRANINIIKLTITNNPTPKKPAKYITIITGEFLEALCPYLLRYSVFSNY